MAIFSWFMISYQEEALKRTFMVYNNCCKIYRFVCYLISDRFLIYFICFWFLVSGHRKDPLAFSWSERYKVAVGVAEALEYLHSGCARPVIHRDVKSSNILLSDDFEPQVMHIYISFLLNFCFSLFILNFEFWVLMLSICCFQLCDFGLAKWAPTSSSHITCTDVAGTFGFVTTTPIFLASMSYLHSCHS